MRERTEAEKALSEALDRLFHAAGGNVGVCRGFREDHFFEALQAVVDERITDRLGHDGRSQ